MEEIDVSGTVIVHKSYVNRRCKETLSVVSDNSLKQTIRAIQNDIIKHAFIPSIECGNISFVSFKRHWKHNKTSTIHHSCPNKTDRESFLQICALAVLDLMYDRYSRIYNIAQCLCTAIATTTYTKNNTFFTCNRAVKTVWDMCVIYSLYCMHQTQMVNSNKGKIKIASSSILNTETLHPLRVSAIYFSELLLCVDHIYLYAYKVGYDALHVWKKILSDDVLQFALNAGPHGNFYFDSSTGSSSGSSNAVRSSGSSNTNVVFSNERTAVTNKRSGDVTIIHDGELIRIRCIIADTYSDTTISSTDGNEDAAVATNAIIGDANSYRNNTKKDSIDLTDLRCRREAYRKSRRGKNQNQQYHTISTTAADVVNELVEEVAEADVDHTVVAIASKTTIGSDTDTQTMNQMQVPAVAVTTSSNSRKRKTTDAAIPASATFLLPTIVHTSTDSILYSDPLIADLASFMAAAGIPHASDASASRSRDTSAEAAALMATTNTRTAAATGSNRNNNSNSSSGSVVARGMNKITSEYLKKGAAKKSSTKVTAVTKKTQQREELRLTVHGDTPINTTAAIVNADADADLLEQLLQVGDNGNNVARTDDDDFEALQALLA